MTAKFLTHPFDARSVMLFASIAFTSALAQAGSPSSSAAAAQSAATPAARMIQADRHLAPNDPRRHQMRQPAKKAM